MNFTITLPENTPNWITKMAIQSGATLDPTTNTLDCHNLTTHTIVTGDLKTWENREAAHKAEQETQKIEATAQPTGETHVIHGGDATVGETEWVADNAFLKVTKAVPFTDNEQYGGVHGGYIVVEKFEVK